MNYGLEFDTGTRLKNRGLDLLEESQEDFLTAARKVAMEIRNRRGKVTADEVRDCLDALGIEPGHPNAYGAIFRSGFTLVGFTRSTRPSNHGRRIAVWA
jgi:hypothetical protein